MIPMPEELRHARDTRLVGMRSTSQCSEAKAINSIQFIYFSLNQTMCDEVLNPITSEMVTEPSSHGPTCEESYFDTSEFDEVKTVNNNYVVEQIEIERTSRSMRIV